MGNSIKPNIERAKKTGTLSLLKQNIDEFPELLYMLSTNLRTLDLAENKLASIPSKIKIFNALKYLSVSNNRLEVLPVEIGELRKLESLLVDNNRLQAIPDSVSRLAALRTLNVSGNRLTQFPSPLCALKNLDSVDLSNNKIKVIPSDVKQLSTIELNLNKNQISDLSEDISECGRLKVLRLDENCLEISAFTPRLLKHSNISLFTIEGNVFTVKLFHQLEGYEQYMERYTATKKKFN